MYFVICSCTCHSLAISRRCFFLKIFPPYVSSLLINVTIYCIFPEQKVIGNVRSRPPPLSWNNPSSCLEQLILLLQFYRAGKAEKWTRRREGERRQCRVRLEEEDGQSFLFLLRPPPLLPRIPLSPPPLLLRSKCPVPTIRASQDRIRWLQALEPKVGGARLLGSRWPRPSIPPLRL
jgi:hypothetical protein